MIKPRKDNGDRGSRQIPLTWPGIDSPPSYVHSVCFSPDGKRLASASGDSKVGIWHAASGQILLILKGHTGDVNSVCFSPDGKRLASASDDKTVKIWDTADGR